MITKSRAENLNRNRAKAGRDDWLMASDPTALNAVPLNCGTKRHIAPQVNSKFKTVSLAEKVLRSPEKYSASFSGNRFTGDKFHHSTGGKPESYHPRLGPGTYRTNGSTFEVKESQKKSPTFRSAVPKFAAFGSSRNTKSYNCRKNWSEKYVKERFRFHAPSNTAD
eukprot:CAMPEP_0184496672 /NCGR_PEP_ID=MMETSP0113_2-20130426/34577_1 /TAXON_ID=91329 /ORGANISM="Norrisiella sphaerica, Strain BC52" /LENGTH=165 /DNA_ID=CAMNT_0026883401 /DNA_START=517 /DNA_END=1014 /DNA_ORIENTATION=-